MTKGFTPLEVRSTLRGHNVMARTRLTALVPKKSPVRKRLRTGFTLIEILVYIAVLSIILVSVLSFLIWAAHSNTKTAVMRETLDNARRAMEVLASEIRESKSIYTPTTAQNQLSLETTKYLPEGEKTTYLDFYLCGTQLCLKKESQQPIALTSDNVEITNLLFTRIVTNQAPSVQIDLTVSYKNPNNRPEYQASVNLKSTVTLRSY